MGKEKGQLTAKYSTTVSNGKENFRNQKVVD